MRGEPASSLTEQLSGAATIEVGCSGQDDDLGAEDEPGAEAPADEGAPEESAADEAPAAEIILRPVVIFDITLELNDVLGGYVR